MPSNETGKTKSARKLLACTVIVSTITVICCLAFLNRSGVETLRVNNHVYYLDVVATEAAMEKGLGGRANMPDNKGMLFDHQRNDSQCYWMKSMQFPLDIIWIGDNHRINHIEKSVQPDTYPKSFCAEGRYVIELNAGQGDAAKLRVGQTLRF